PPIQYERRIADLRGLAIGELPRARQTLARIDQGTAQVAAAVFPEMDVRGLVARRAARIQLPPDRAHVLIHRVVHEHRFAVWKTQRLDATQVHRVRGHAGIAREPIADIYVAVSRLIV